MEQPNCLQEVMESEIHPNAGPTCKECRSQWRPPGKFGEVSTQRRNNRWRGSPAITSGQWKGISSIVHHVEPRVHLHVPKEETFPRRMKFLDVTRATRTNLDVLQESRTDDCWNVEVDRHLPDSWTRFTKFTSLDEKPPKRTCVVRGTDYKNSSNHQTWWFAAWSLVRNDDSSSEKGKAAMGCGKTQALSTIWSSWSFGRLQTFSRRFVSLKWCRHACLLDFCWNLGLQIVVGHPRLVRTLFLVLNLQSIAASVGISNCFLPDRWNKCLSVFEHHWGFNSIIHCSLVHTFVPMPQAMKIPDAKAAVEKEQRSSKSCRRGNWPRWRTKKEVILEAQKEKNKVHFATLMDICHLKNAELEPKYQKYKGRVVLWGDTVTDDSGSCAVFTEQGSSASQMTAAKVMDVIVRLRDCAGQAADAVSACTQTKNGGRSKLFKIPKSECPYLWIRLPRHKRPNSWSTIEDPVVPLERNLYGHPLAGLLWRRQFEEVPLGLGWEKELNWESLIVHRKQGLFLSVHVDDTKKAGRKKQKMSPMWKTLMKLVDLGEPTSFLDHVHLGCTQRECKPNEIIIDE